MRKSSPEKEPDVRNAIIKAYNDAGGDVGFSNWCKKHRTTLYSYFVSLLPRTVNSNINANINANVHVDDESARRKLEDAFLRLIDARRAAVGDPAVYVDGERLIEHRPASRDPASSADDSRPLSVDPSPPPAADAPRSRPATIVQSFVAGQCAGSLDGLDDNLSTTQRFLNWRGHGGPP